MLCQEGVETFKAFCGNTPEMDQKSFAKLCKDCGLVDHALNIRDVDLIFVKVVPKGQRRMGFQKFEDALRLVAEKKGAEACDVCRAVEQSCGPIFRTTKAEAVRFHDDRSTYTGTQARGGPRTSPRSAGSPSRKVSPDSPRRMHSYPGQGAVREVSLDSPRRMHTFPGSGQAIRDDAASAGQVVHAVCLWEAPIEQVFQFYCGGQPSMDGKSFLKLCKDSQLNDRCLTTTELDLIFTKVVPKGHRRINLRCFHHALWHIAEKKGMLVDRVCSTIALLGSNGPILHGTKAETVRFHDDKSTYTGTHAHGGPDVGPTSKISASEKWLTSLRPEAKGEARRRSGEISPGSQLESTPRRYTSSSPHRCKVASRDGVQVGAGAEVVHDAYGQGGYVQGGYVAVPPPQAALVDARSREDSGPTEEFLLSLMPTQAAGHVNSHPSAAQGSLSAFQQMLLPVKVPAGRGNARSGPVKPSKLLDYSDPCSLLAEALLAEAFLTECLAAPTY